ncbi:MAG: response regulator transcription factor [Nitrospirota bacterium]|jgi:FixJ family two-component response regulator
MGAINHEPTVFVVDDDESFRRSVRWLLASVNLKVALFASAQDFLKVVRPGQTGCLVTDVRMPGMSGLELQQAMAARDIRLPVIVMTAHGDVDMAVRAMKDGAMDFIQKPFNDQVFLDLVQKAIADSLLGEADRQRQAELRRRLEQLTPREREVLDLIVDGKTNKSIADTLCISEKTVEAHRARVMDKTGAGSLAELMKMVLASNAG